MTIFQHIRERLYQQKGLPLYDMDELRKSEWSYDFELLMRRRLLMGALRYGKLGAEGKPRYNRLKSILKRIKIYQSTGNTECLVDIANLCLCEFVEGRHPNKHFHAVDNTTEHVK